MQETLSIQTLAWMILAAIVGSLVVYRKFVSHAESDALHLSDAESEIVSDQKVLAHKLTAVDKWGKILTVLLIAYGIFVAGEYLFFAWSASTRIAG